MPFDISWKAFWHGLLNIEAGDWLQSGAAILGIFLTIRATMWLEDRKRRQERVAEKNLVIEALVTLRDILPVATTQLNPEQDLAKRIRITRGQYEIIKSGRDALASARRTLTTRNYNLWNYLTMVEEEFARSHARFVP